MKDKDNLVFFLDSNSLTILSTEELAEINGGDDDIWDYVIGAVAGVALYYVGRWLGRLFH